MDLRDAVSFHQLVIASEGRSEATARQYLYFEKVYLDFLDASGIMPDLSALNAANVRAALAWYQQQPRKGSRSGLVGAKTLVDTLHLFARFLEREGVYEDDPLRKVRPVKVAKLLRQPFTQTEIIALWGACRQSQLPTRDEALFLLLLDTGMRIGEACTLTLDRVRLDQRLIVIGDEGKGRQERLVPFGASDKRDGGRGIRALRKYLADRPHDSRGGNRVFLGRDHYALEAPGGSDAIVRLGQIANVANVGPHRLRHTFCTWYLVTYPGDEIGLRRIVGHLSKEVLSSYVHFAQSLIAERAGRASLADRWLPDSHTPVPISGRGNVRAYHCADCKRRGDAGARHH